MKQIWGEGMNKTMYEVNWHQVGNAFSHCTVTPITVVREGVLPGCTGVSITAIAHDGRKFQGSPGDYYETEEDAWAAVKGDLMASIDALETQSAAMQVDLTTQREYLKGLP